MIQPIMKDVLFLGQKSEEATELDKQIITDLHDTLAAHREHCVGMAANMIGQKKRIIIVSFGFMDMVLVNPVIIQKSQAKSTMQKMKYNTKLLIKNVPPRIYISRASPLWKYEPFTKIFIEKLEERGRKNAEDSECYVTNCKT